MTERSADREEVGHRMYTNRNGGPQSQIARSQLSKRYNLVIEGIPDVPIEEVYAFVIRLADSLNVILYKRDISNVTRIARRPVAAGGKRSNPGPVVVTFVHAHLRDAILRNKVDLKGILRYKSVYVNPDEPLDIRRQRARFRRIAYLARLDGQTVSYRGDSIRIGDDEYKVADIAKIPDKYIPKEDPRYVNAQVDAQEDDDRDSMPPLELRNWQRPRYRSRPRSKSKIWRLHVLLQLIKPLCLRILAGLFSEEEGYVLLEPQVFCQTFF